jgi:cysteine-S-conjugate beta-lyase
MTAYNFDQVTERRSTHSSKWTRYPEGVLPFWVADMDIRAPDFILDALGERIRQGIIGYSVVPPELEIAFIDWLERQYRWTVQQDWLVWIPGVVTGFNLAARAIIQPGDGLLIPKPVYYPFLDVPAHVGGRALPSDLVRDRDRFVMDMDDLDDKAANARLFMLCNPQNPTGRVYSHAELSGIVDLCLRHDLYLMSDEIHCPLILDPTCRHIPIATLSAELAQRSITLFSPTKAYNIPGLGCAVAVIPDPVLREKFLAARAGIVPGISPLAYLACQLSYADRSDWLPSMLAWLQGNLQLVQQAVGARMTRVEATYLAWIDVRGLGLKDPAAHFVRHGLGLSLGEQFGGPGFVRFNFGCPRPILTEGLERLGRALGRPEA